MESPPAATTTAGIYCKACSYDLRASGEARRCPECGRVFSPHDPKTFYPRPFAAPWKRAAGRWARRGAILLLVLAVLLAGVWGWYYWGWKQERAVLAQVGFTWDSRVAILVGGTPGRWLHDRRIPGSFVVERVRAVELSKTATDADVRAMRKLTQLESLTVLGPITDAGMAHLRNCPRLRGLRIQSPHITDAGLAALRDLPRLEWLDVTGGSFSAAGLAGLASLPDLRYLSLRGTPLTDAGLATLASLGKLQRLDLSFTRVTDAGLIHLEKLRALARLDLWDTRVADAGLVHLEKLTALNDLDLRGTRVTDAGLVHLEKLTGLEDLNLTRTQVTDDGLVHLEKLPALRFLYLLDTRVTPAGVARLKAALPGCSILGP